jgi:N-acetylglutamate synthase-like GNAT family acetyltransferase
LIHDLVDLARDRGVERLFTFSKDTGNYFIHTGWHDVFLADAVPHIEATMQVQHYHAVGWYADERALRIDL